MTNPRQFTDIERAAMEAASAIVRAEGGAPFLIEQFGLGKRAAFRIAGQQLPPPVGIAEDLADHAEQAMFPGEQVAALRAFVAQRRTPKGGRDGQA